MALGTQPSTECLENVCKLAKLLKGERGILVTKEGLAEVKKQLASVTADEFAKAGFTATKTITLEVRIHLSICGVQGPSQRYCKRKIHFVRFQFIDRLLPLVFSQMAVHRRCLPSATYLTPTAPRIVYVYCACVRQERIVYV